MTTTVTPNEVNLLMRPTEGQWTDILHTGRPMRLTIFITDRFPVPTVGEHLRYRFPLFYYK